MTVGSDAQTSTAMSGFDSDSRQAASIRDSARNAVRLADEHHIRSLAFPRISAGSGGFNQDKAQAILLSELEALETPIEATLTIFKR